MPSLEGAVRLLATVDDQANLKKEAAFERAYGTAVGIKSSKGESHERNPDEISWEGCGGSKALRG